MRVFTCSSNLQLILPLSDVHLNPKQYSRKDNVNLGFNKKWAPLLGRFPSIAVSQAQCYVHENAFCIVSLAATFLGRKERNFSPKRLRLKARRSSTRPKTNPQTLQKPDPAHGGLSEPVVRRRSPRTGHASSSHQPTCRLRKASGPRQKPDKDRAGQQERVRSGPGAAREAAASEQWSGPAVARLPVGHT